MNVMKLMVVALAGWINQQQEDVIDYLREEVRILKDLQGKRRLRFTDDPRPSDAVHEGVPLNSGEWGSEVSASSGAVAQPEGHLRRGSCGPLKRSAWIG